MCVNTRGFKPSRTRLKGLFRKIGSTNTPKSDFQIITIQKIGFVQKQLLQICFQQKNLVLPSYSYNP